MKLTKIVSILTAALMLFALPVLALAEDAGGSAAVTQGQTYTLEQMLTFAIQDEYAAQAEYEKILAAYGDNNAFANIVKAEETHIAELRTLFAAYGFTVPENTEAQSAVLPASLQEAYETGVTAEVANIAMYENFLANTTLPQAVRDVFAELQSASQSHLEAMTRNVEKDGLGMGYGRDADTQHGNGNRNDDSDVQQGNGSRSNSQGQGNNRADDTCNSGDCDNSSRYADGNRSGNRSATRNDNTCDGACDETETGSRQMGGRRSNDD